MFALKLTEKLFIQGSSMTYGSKHTDSAVEFKNQPQLPTSRDRYLRIPDPLSSQIRIPKQLGRSGSIEPIRSDNTHPHPTSHASSAPPVDSKNGTTIHQNKKTQLKKTKNKNSHKKSYTFSIFTPHNRISIIAPNHLTLYIHPKSSHSPKPHTHQPKSTKKTHTQTIRSSNIPLTHPTTQHTTHAKNHQTQTMSSWIAAAKSNNKKNRRPDRNRNSSSSQSGKRQKQQPTKKIKIKPEDIQCINITTDALADDFRLPVSKFRTTLLKTDFCLPRKLYDLCLALREHPKTAPDRFMHTLITLIDPAMASFTNKDTATALSWEYYDHTLDGIENPPIAIIVLRQIIASPWILAHAFLDTANDEKAFMNRTPVMVPCPICHCGTPSFRSNLEPKLQYPQSDVFNKNNHTLDAYTKLLPSRAWKTHMNEPGYDPNKFEFWSSQSRLTNRGIHEFLYALNKLLQPQIDTLLASLTTPLNKKEQNELDGIQADSDDDSLHPDSDEDHEKEKAPKSPTPKPSSQNNIETFSTPPQSALKKKAVTENAASAKTNLTTHMESNSDYDDKEKAAIETANKNQKQTDEQFGESPANN